MLPRVLGRRLQGWAGGRPSGAHLDGVIAQDACHAAGAVGDGDCLAGALVGGGLLRVEALVVGCQGEK